MPCNFCMPCILIRLWYYWFSGLPIINALFRACIVRSACDYRFASQYILTLQTCMIIQLHSGCEPNTHTVLFRELSMAVSMLS